MARASVRRRSRARDRRRARAAQPRRRRAPGGERRSVGARRRPRPRARLPRRLRDRRAGGRGRVGGGRRAAPAGPTQRAVARAVAAGAAGRSFEWPRRGARLRGADAARPRRPRPRAPARGGAPARDRARHGFGGTRGVARAGRHGAAPGGARRPAWSGCGGRAGGFGGRCRCRADGRRRVDARAARGAPCALVRSRVDSGLGERQLRLGREAGVSAARSADCRLCQPQPYKVDNRSAGLDPAPLNAGVDVRPRRPRPRALPRRRRRGARRRGRRTAWRSG